MESLFVRQAPKKGRVGLMLAASLLFHGGIVGIAALWLQPDPEEHTVIIGELIPVEEGKPAPWSPPATPEVSEIPDATTPTPPDAESIPTPPVLTQDPEMEETVKPTPVPRRSLSVRPAMPTRVTGPQTTSHSTTNQPGSGVPGNANAGPAGAVGVWSMPHPPYPPGLLASHATGATTVQITTDASGRVSNVVILKSAGNPVFDNQTENYVRTHWHGPPNASRTTQFIYQIR